MHSLKSLNANFNVLSLESKIVKISMHCNFAWINFIDADMNNKYLVNLIFNRVFQQKNGGQAGGCQQVNPIVRITPPIVFKIGMCSFAY